MSFDVRDFSEVPPEDKASGPRNRRWVSTWLFVMCALLWVMIVLGGATRLTGSGLSIMEWAPLMGALPPLSGAEWQRLFALYKTIPQYGLLNPDMDLVGFKRIFWLEWTHRSWGRMLGLAFVVPLIWFWAIGWIAPRVRWRLLGILVLGGLQAAVGWIMVASGFMPDSVAVSPYRLVAHLALALLLYAAVFWTGLQVWRPLPVVGLAYRGLRALVGVCVALLALTLLAGGFVAGLRAGFDYNSFPLMDGRLIPAGYARLEPMLRNLTENIAAVQFNHRLLASLALLGAGAVCAGAWFVPRQHPARLAMVAFGVLTALQYMIGVMTLLLVVPVDMGVLHQSMAVIVLSVALAALHALRPPPFLVTAIPDAAPGGNGMLARAAPRTDMRVGS
ncbi:MAG: heme A synthase [Acetobacteraceae bacterium]|nr:heme A synthase [Acetobacteraceae bacterium]